ncbi:phosphoribosyltransferase family protein [Neobacillus ginsengisoli]|uniref:Adenine/guanine phosphoribosyltransferase n=1 Tax=Neobacillus ginsengisoli TaxID=904295 RepID=A0ABT9XRP6_9BACI|nr:phosphoribosyltransferase family protein [Neobacillus ginsengisoli]MDQ0197609.1 hypothetical protein [Neobacillus ginsengisoli]
MKDSQILTLSKKKYTYSILDSIDVGIEITHNPYRLPVERLFTMAARMNKKRSFLFVSKLLGKHLPINPNKGLLTAALLAARYAEEVKGLECVEKERLLSLFPVDEPSFKRISIVPKTVKPLVIGFAETATGLGHAFFDCFEFADYFHTTREVLLDRYPEITFEEEHSHATSHHCYIPLEMIQHEREIILVDDEITTGKTALNIIQSIHARFPRLEYTVVSILDWRSEEHKREFALLEKNLGITISVVSLLAGKVEIKQHKKIQECLDKKEMNNRLESKVECLQLSSFFATTAFLSAISQVEAPFIQETGRFGIQSTGNDFIHHKLSEAASFLKQKRNGKKTLCLGTGEFMYLPMKLAAEMGYGVSYQSTTRSPIYIRHIYGYGAKHGITFPNPENQAISHFVYNIPPDHYDDIFIFIEREVEFEKLKPLVKELEKLQIKSIKFVFFSKRYEVNLCKK